MSKYKKIREERAKIILSKEAAIAKIKNGLYTVQSQTGIGRYRVEWNGAKWVCNCPDYIKRGNIRPCKHILALKLHLEVGYVTIEGVDYQNGEQLGFWNTREYVLHRDNHACQHCHGKKKDPILQVHHVNGKAEGATDRPEELLTVCKTCHDEHHAGIDIISKKKIKNFKPETFMTMVRWKLVNTLGCKHTYGYITKHNRIKQGLEKSHVNDAFVIAGGTTQERCKTIFSKQVRRNNRKLQVNRKGFKPSIRRQRYKLQPNDLVKFNGGEYRVKGVHSYGKCVISVNYHPLK